MDIKTKAFNNAINTLKALGTKFVVIDAQGNRHTHGDLEVTTRKRGKLQFPRNTYRNLATEQGLEMMQVGDVFMFDPKETKVESLRCTIISQAAKLWGKNSLTTSVRDGKVEALRIV